MADWIVPIYEFLAKHEANERIKRLIREELLPLMHVIKAGAFAWPALTPRLPLDIRSRLLGITSIKADAIEIISVRNPFGIVQGFDQNAFDRLVRLSLGQMTAGEQEAIWLSALDRRFDHFLNSSVVEVALKKEIDDLVSTLMPPIDRAYAKMVDNLIDHKEDPDWNNFCNHQPRILFFKPIMEKSLFELMLAATQTNFNRTRILLSMLELLTIALPIGKKRQDKSKKLVWIILHT